MIICVDVRDVDALTLVCREAACKCFSTSKVALEEFFHQIMKRNECNINSNCFFKKLNFSDCSSNLGFTQPKVIHNLMEHQKNEIHSLILSLIP